VRHQKHETARLQDECSVMREALEARGEMGALQRALVQARADRLRLWLGLGIGIGLGLGLVGSYP